jgi:hypothetical protein
LLLSLLFLFVIPGRGSAVVFALTQSTEQSSSDPEAALLAAAVKKPALSKAAGNPRISLLLSRGTKLVSPKPTPQTVLLSKTSSQQTILAALFII